MGNRPILVIDDDPSSCELVTDILITADFDVLSAPDGLSGLGLARIANPLVIILDMMMPDMDGIGTLQRLKRDPDLKHIPVVGVTASAELTYLNKAYRAGAQFFLSKPFGATSLVGVIELAVNSALGSTVMHRRRRHPRFPAEIPFQCSVQAAPGTTRGVAGHTGNLSLGGILALLPEKVAPGTAVRLGLQIAEGLITARGKVVWQAPQSKDEENFRHGVRFEGFAEDGALFEYRRYLGQLSVDRTI
jgi:CheY-like chemotaxis protein